MHRPLKKGTRQLITNIYLFILMTDRSTTHTQSQSNLDSSKSRSFTEGKSIEKNRRLFKNLFKTSSFEINRGGKTIEKHLNKKRINQNNNSNNNESNKTRTDAFKKEKSLDKSFSISFLKIQKRLDTPMKTFTKELNKSQTYNTVKGSNSFTSNKTKTVDISVPKFLQKSKSLERIVSKSDGKSNAKVNRGSKYVDSALNSSAPIGQCHLIDPEKKSLKSTEVTKIKQPTSEEVDEKDSDWFKVQMLAFLNKIPKCSPSRPKRKVAFEWLSSYLNFLSTKFLNLDFYTKRPSGQLFNAFSENICIQIIHTAAEICETENMLLELTIPPKENEIIVISDIHGSIADVIRAFSFHGLPGDKTYLFLGDYVDRGVYEVEVVMLLFILKICFSKHVYLLRGNHEFPEQNKKFDLPRSCKKQFSSANYWRILNFAFDRLSVAAIINDEIYCAHGGVSQWVRGRHSISNLVKPMSNNSKFTERLVLTDIVWSDTIRNEVEEGGHFFQPTIRGLGFAYSERGLKEVIKLLKVKKIIRGHHPHPNGFLEDYKNLCYTVHARQIESGSYGSTCSVYLDPKTKKICIDAKNYKIEHFFKNLHDVAKEIENISTTYFIRQHEFTKMDSYDNKIINSNVDCKIKNMHTEKMCFDESNVETSTTIECKYCLDYDVVIDECTSRYRFFVSHIQLYLLMLKYHFPKFNGPSNVYKSNCLGDKLELFITRFPCFFDFISTFHRRNGSIISRNENRLMKMFDSNKKDVHSSTVKLSVISYNMLSNQMYFENFKDEDIEIFENEINSAELMIAQRTQERTVEKKYSKSKSNFMNFQLIQERSIEKKSKNSKP
uniref:Serine/threonine-protein phosphatase 5 (inferred by orthology to a human protein) n=1 Tax=Strongyloides venezuelensis TaxID=75913 RepID=A0A0K0FZR8_STRVS